MKALTTASLVVLLAVFAVASLAFLIPTLSQTTLIADDFFVNLVENKAEISQGTAIFDLKNPTPATININANILSLRFQNGGQETTPLKSTEFFVEKNIMYSTNVTDYSTTCNTFEVTNVSGTFSVSNCTTQASGWHWNNITKSGFVPLNSIALNPNQTARIKIIAHWTPKLGSNNREWFPQITVNSNAYEQSKWAWWNTTYGLRANETVYSIAGGNLYKFPHPINGSFWDTANLVSGGSMKSDCKDVQVLNGSDAKQNFEWEIYNNGTYGCNAAKSILWTKMDVLSNNNDSILSWYYNNPDETNFYNSTTTTWSSDFGMVLHFKEDGGSLVKDSTGNVNNGAITGNPTWQDGKFGRALRFDGSGDNIEVNHSASIAIQSSSSPFGIEFWMYLDANTGYIVKKEPQYLIAFGDPAANDKLNCAFYDGSWTNSMASATNPPANTWVHVFCKKNNTGMYIYVNGSLAGSDTSIGTPQFPMSNLFIASHQAGGGYITGLIDEFRFYDSVDPSDDWIRASYNYGIASGLVQDSISTTNESSARTSMENGILSSLVSVPIYSDQKIYLRNLSNYQQLSSFDKVVKYGGQIWAFNYLTGSDTLTNMPNITPAFYVLEMQNLTTNNVIAQRVSAFINQTKTS